MTISHLIDPRILHSTFYIDGLIHQFPVTYVIQHLLLRHTKMPSAAAAAAAAAAANTPAHM
jgi:hypothetical protein